MIKKKIQTIGIACFMLLATLTIVSSTITAENPCTIRGYVYVDGVITEPSQITLTIASKDITVDNIYSDGYYEIMDDIPTGTGIFKVKIGASTWQAKETIKITSIQDGYKLNLSIDTSEEPIETEKDTQAPSKVTGLSITDAKDGKLDLSWNPATDNVGISHYKIYRDGSFLTNNTGTTFRNTGLTNGVTYCYTISAVDTSGNEGEQSDEKCKAPTKYVPPSGDDDDDGPSGDDTPAGDDEEDEEVIPNNPPEILEFDSFDGVLTGSINEPMSFYAIAMDPDGDYIKYEFDWADTNTNSTDFMANNTRYNITHIWTSAGVYRISVRAIDDYQDGNGTWSAKEYIQVLIDARIIDNDDVDGYLTDDEGDGVYDTFHNNDDGTSSNVTKEGDFYLIDLNGDGTPDYKYDPDTGSGETIDTEDNEPSDDTEPSGQDNTPLYVGIILIIIILLLLFFLATRKKKGKKK